MKKLFLFFSVLYSLSFYATFTLSGSTITQTGTDTSLSALAGVGGVTTTVTGSGTNTFTIYNFPSNRTLVIDGTLTIDPEKEMLVCNNLANNGFTINGLLNIGTQNTISTNTYYTRGTGLVITDTSGGWTYTSIKINNGGKIALYGSTIRLSGRIYVETGATVLARSAAIVSSDQTTDNRLRLQNGDLDVDGLELIGYWVNMATNVTQAKGIKIVNTSGPEFNFSTTSGGYFIRFDDYDTTFTTSGFYAQKDVIAYGSAFVKLYNPVNGSEVSFRAEAGTGVGEVIKQLSVEILNAQGVAVPDAVMYIKDTNNGNRANVQPKGYSAPNDYVNDRVYNVVSNGSGKFPTQDILTDVMRGQNIHDRRSKNNNTDDIFDVNFWHYNYLYSHKSYALRGAGITKSSENLLLDPNVSLSATDAAAITGISVDHDTKKITVTGQKTLCDLYDFVKNNKLSNIEKPTISDLAANPIGRNLDISDYQLVLPAGSKLSPCDKFDKVISSVASSIADPSVSLEVALTDAAGKYKLIRLQNLINSKVTIKDNVTNTILRQEINFTGDINLTVQNNSQNVSLLVERVGYTNWGTSIDLTSADVFNYVVVQTNGFGNPATLPNQEEELYLMKKLLSKSQAIESALNNQSTTTLNETYINQTNATVATVEKQQELIEILKRVLSKITLIREKTK